MRKIYDSHRILQGVMVILLLFVGQRAQGGEYFEHFISGPFTSITLTGEAKLGILQVDLNKKAGGKYIYVSADKINKGNINWFGTDSQRPITRLVILTGSEWAYSNNKVYTEGDYTYYPVNVEGDLNGDLNQGAGGDDIYLYYSKDHPERGFVSEIWGAYYENWLNGGASKPSYYFDKDLNDGCGINSYYVYLGAKYHEHKNYTEMPLWREDGMLCTGFDCCAHSKVQLEGNGSELIPYQIGSMEDLNAFAFLFNQKRIPQNSYVELSQDIKGDLVHSSTIGRLGYPFRGHFNGKGHTITNETNAEDVSVYTGMFASTKYAEISHLTVKNMIVAGRESMINTFSAAKSYYTRNYSNGINTPAVISSIDEGSLFEKCHLRSCMECTNGKDVSGLLVGQAKDSHIEDCSCVNQPWDIKFMQKEYSNVGLVGRASGKLTIRNCFFDAWTSERPLLYEFTGNQADCVLENCYTAYNIITKGNATTIRTYENVTDGYSTGQICTQLGDNWEQDVFHDAYPTTGTRGVILDGEDADSDFFIYAQLTGKVTLKRTFASNEWHALCLPFDVDTEQTIKTFSKVAMFAWIKGDTCRFEVVHHIEAGKPYIVMVDQPLETPSFTNVTINTGVTADGSHDFVGTLNKVLLGNGSKTIGAGHTVIPATSGTMPPFQAYFPPSEKTSGIKYISIHDNLTTSVAALPLRPSEAPAYHDLNGRRVPATHRGIVIHNGRKYLRR